VKVAVWRGDSQQSSELPAALRRWRQNGWRIRRCEPRVLEGPMFGALVVLERERPATTRRHRRPIPPPVSPENRPAM